MASWLSGLLHLTRGLEYGIWVVDTSRLELNANGMGTRIGDMDSLAMPPAIQHGWLPGNGEREGVRLLKETDSNMTTLASSARRFCRDLFLPLDAHRSVMILLKKILSCPRDFWVVGTTRLGCALGMERVRGLELWTL